MYPYIVEGGRAKRGPNCLHKRHFYNGINLLVRAESSWPICFPKDPIPTLWHCWLVSTWSLEGKANHSSIQYISFLSEKPSSWHFSEGKREVVDHAVGLKYFCQWKETHGKWWNRITLCSREGFINGTKCIGSYVKGCIFSQRAQASEKVNESMLITQKKTIQRST